MTAEERAALREALVTSLANKRLRTPEQATVADFFEALAATTRERLVDRWMETRAAYRAADAKRVYYLSAEFLLGRSLTQNLVSLGLYDVARDALGSFGVELADVLEAERDPGLGNGGLGRLAACFLESLATLKLPAYGYGIRYDYGIFEQHVVDGQQVEKGDDWLRHGNPWEVRRPECTTVVHFGGRVEESADAHGVFRARWLDTHHVLGVPYDMPVAGFGGHTVNTLRLWSARAAQDFDLELFNAGDYRRAVEAKSLTESISKVLYPNDESPEGRELRLKQQYFFVACSLHDILRRYHEEHEDLDHLPEKIALQLNDTHPAIAVAELMRILVDLEQLPWDRAWAITRACVGYTNHTLLPEALERWPVPMFGRLLPRHLGIIYEINRRFLRQVQIRFPFDQPRLARMSIIEEGPVKQVRMAHLATVGAHSVNGVAALHSELVKANLLPDFAEMWPERFNNKTNGVTPRRWLYSANPDLATLISAHLGTDWVTHLDQLEALAPLAEDAAFVEAVAAVKRANKQRLADIIAARNGLPVDVDSMFDVQVKRIHEYKRQLLNVLHIVALYLRLKDDPTAAMTPRTFIFGGKAAPGYAVAKHHIRLINDVADTLNADPMVEGRLRVVFLANYGVSLAERIIPATDLSEQISTAGKEASGTGNMKFAMNGALTMGTLDGANIEIREAVGPENFFLFGLTAEQVAETRARGYDPMAFVRADETLARVLDLLASGFFSPGDPNRYADIVHGLKHHDPYLLCADFGAYLARQDEAGEAYGDPTRWGRMVVRNIAHTGRFSSDRTIAEYAREIWKLAPVSVPAG